MLLSWTSFVLLSAFCLIFLFLIKPDTGNLPYWAFLVFFIFFAVFILVLGGGLFLITISALFKRDFLFPHNGMQITMRIIPDWVNALSRLIRIENDRILESFISLHNRLFEAQRKRIKTDKILILLPHCLQNHDCPWKITWSVENCKKCGKCPIGKLTELSERYNTSLYVATGGTLARRVVKEVRPTVILAVACQRDLSSGIVDTYPIPVYGILNERPNGPCFDTMINTEKVEEILKWFLE